jgi:DNA polymerase III alpha subunit
MRAGFATPQDALVHLAWEGAAARYPDGIPDSVRQSLDHELALIAQLNYAPYFLTVHHIVGYARSQNILCQGRGSAANSAVCYCLRITDVDPRDGNLLFERFISSDRGEPPDIDVDFEHERREEVIQHIYSTIGATIPASPRPSSPIAAARPSARSARPSGCRKTRSARSPPRSGAWAAARCAPPSSRAPAST